MKNRNLRTGKNCFYCDNIPVIKASAFGNLYECPNCKAYVSADGFTNEPLGSLADAELRKKRRIVHYYTSELIKRTMKKKSLNYTDAKQSLYNWLSKKIELDFEMDSIAQLFPSETDDIINIMKYYVKR